MLLVNASKYINEFHQFEIRIEQNVENKSSQFKSFTVTLDATKLASASHCYI